MEIRSWHAVLMGLISLVMPLRMVSEPESVEKKLNHIRYCEMTHLARIDAFCDLFKLMQRSSVNSSLIYEFVKTIEGVFNARSRADIAVLIAWNEALKLFCNPKTRDFEVVKERFATLATILAIDLQAFVLKDGDIVALSTNDAAGGKAFAVVVIKDGEYVVTQASSKSLASLFRLNVVERPTQSDDAATVSSDTKIVLTPLYGSYSGVSCGLANSKIGLKIERSSDGKNGLLVLSHPGAPALADIFSFQRRDKSSIYDASMVTLVGRRTHAKWSGCLERVDESVCAELKNAEYSQALARINAIASVEKRCSWMNVMRPGCIQDLSAENKQLVCKIWGGMVAARHEQDAHVIRALRSGLVKYAALDAFEAYQKNFNEWLVMLNTSLADASIEWGKVCTMVIPDATERALCINRSVDQSNQFIVGRIGVAAQTHTPELLSLVSPYQHQGVIFFGDEVEIVPAQKDVQRAQMLCALVPEGSMQNSLSSKLVICKQGYYDDQMDTSFILTPPEDMSAFLAGKKVPVASGDSVRLRSKKTGNFLGISAGHHNHLIWADVVASSDQNSPRITEFCIGIVADDVVKGNVTKNFYDQLALIDAHQTYCQKIEMLDQALNLFSPLISVQERDDLWDLVHKLVADKKHMNEQDLKKLATFLQRLCDLADAHAIAGWAERARQAHQDVLFYSQVRVALAQPGISQFQVLLDMVPQLQKVSMAESRDFLNVLGKIRMRKKAESRAAKLLFSHACQELGPDLDVTGTGNLLVP